MTGFQFCAWVGVMSVLHNRSQGFTDSQSVAWTYTVGEMLTLQADVGVWQAFVEPCELQVTGVQVFEPLLRCILAP